MAQDRMASVMQTDDEPKRSREILQDHESISDEEKAYQAIITKLGSLAQALRDVVEPITLSTPQADHGIGPVKYDTYFQEGEYMDWEALEALNELFQREKIISDAMIKSEARGMAFLYGCEDPLPWIPAAQRVAIRYEMQERTIREMIRAKCGILKDFPSYDVYNMVRDCEKKGGLPDDGTIALISKLAKCELDDGLETDGADETSFFGLIDDDMGDIDHTRNLLAMRRAQQHVTTATRETLKLMRFYRRCSQYDLAGNIGSIKDEIQKEMAAVRQEQLKKTTIDRLVAEFCRRNEIEIVDGSSISETTADEQEQLAEAALHESIARFLCRNGFKVKECVSNEVNAE